MSDRRRHRLQGRICHGVPFGEEHLGHPDYLSWLRDYEVIRTLNLPSYWQPVEFEEAARYCRGLVGSDQDHYFALYFSSEERFVGTVRIGHIDWDCGTGDIGIMIGDRSYWGRGIAQDAVAAASRLAFGDLGLRRLTAGAMAVNQGMIHVFEKLGFKREACLRKHDRLREGDYCDHIYLGCFEDEFVAAGTSLHHDKEAK
jgi:[ribosomal protein S5]-alanine N-acetyltransferase